MEKTINNEELNSQIDAYLDAHWEAMLQDLATLVSVESVECLEEAGPGAPYGLGPRRALRVALGIAARMGFKAFDADGYLGFADLFAQDELSEEVLCQDELTLESLEEDARPQLGIIAHVDVVPAGPGWHFPPFELTRKDGYVIGRGVTDDKGPLLMALWAVKFWLDQGMQFPYDLRFIFGANEETGMRDMEYFHKHFLEPTFLFTPDAEFPVSYGEKGIYNGSVLWPRDDEGLIVGLEAGVAANAVPGIASVLVRASLNDGLPEATGISATEDGEGLLRIEAAGKSAHASTPELGVNALQVLVDYLLANDLCSASEREFLEFEQKLLSSFDGSGVGLACSDEHFGPLTLVGSMIASIERDGHTYFEQTFDCRFPTTISGEEISETMNQLASEINAITEVKVIKEPFLVDPDSPMIQALLTAYNEVTGEDAEPFTMGGGTYARKFSNAASFGAEFPHEDKPDWVGGMHGPDEGASEESLKQAFRIYAHTIKRLMELEF